jgi:hypothetical protein
MTLSSEDAMTNANNRCGRCHSNKDVLQRYVPCACSSRKRKDSRATWTKEDLTVWQLAICRACLNESYRDYLKAQRDNLVASLKWGAFGIVIGVVGFCVVPGILAGSLPHVQPRGFFEIVSWLIYATLALLLLGGILSLLAGLFKLAKFGIPRSNPSDSDDLPDSLVDKAFKAEATRIIGILDGSAKAGKQRKHVAKYALPQPNRFAHLTESQRNQAEHQNRDTVRREPIVVGASHAQVIEALPHDWRAIWDKKNAG